MSQIQTESTIILVCRYTFDRNHFWQVNRIFFRLGFILFNHFTPEQTYTHTHKSLSKYRQTNCIILGFVCNHTRIRICRLNETGLLFRLFSFLIFPALMSNTSRRVSDTTDIFSINGGHEKVWRPRK